MNAQNIMGAVRTSVLTLKDPMSAPVLRGSWIRMENPAQVIIYLNSHLTV